MPQDQKFEIPQELRQLAEENVERARQLYVQFMDGRANHGRLVIGFVRRSCTRISSSPGARCETCK